MKKIFIDKVIALAATAICVLSLCACADNRMPNGLIKNPDSISVTEGISSSKMPKILSEKSEINSVMQYFNNLKYTESDGLFEDSEEKGVWYCIIGVSRGDTRVAYIDVFESGRVQVRILDEGSSGVWFEIASSVYITEKGVVDHGEVIALIRKYQYGK